MSDAKGVPEDDVGVCDRLSTVTNPLHDPATWLSGGLGDVVTRDPKLVVPVYCGCQCVFASKGTREAVLAYIW